MGVTRRLRLTFPTDTLDKPIVYKLIRDYDLVFNILGASVTQEETGRMVIEVTGERDIVKKGVDYLKKSGVDIIALWKSIENDGRPIGHNRMSS